MKAILQPTGWLLRRAGGYVVGGAAVAILFTLLWPSPLRWNSGWPVLFVFVHALLLVGAMGGARGPSRAYLYTRGWTRDRVWLHLALATAVAVLAVWMPAALVVWTAIRSTIQEAAGNPWFPVMAPAEFTAPPVWLLLYVVVTAAAHFAWIRSAQPTRGREAGLFLVAGLVPVFLTLFIFRYHPTWFACTAVVLGLVAVAALLAAGRRLHRLMEVGQ